MSLTLFNGSYLGQRPTGLGVVARDLVAALNPEQVRLLDPLGGDRPGSIAIPANLGPEHGWRGHLRRLLWLQTAVPQLMQQHRADLLLSPVAEAPLLRGVRTVVLAHDLLPLRYPQLTPLLPYHLSYVPLVLHRAQRVLCNSEATAREVHNRLKIPLKRIVPIRLGFNPGNLRPLERLRERFFLVLGRHDPHKNLRRVLQAFSKLPEQDCTLHLVGPHDRRYTPMLMRQAEELGIDQRCRWTDWVSDSERLELLNRCQALVIASLWEGFGLPALEALACGTPVIASKAGALPEVVGDAGFLVNPFDPLEISAVMSDVLRDESIVAKARVSGPKHAELFNWESTGRQLEQLLMDLG